MKRERDDSDDGEWSSDVEYAPRPTRKRRPSTRLLVSEGDASGRGRVDSDGSAMWSDEDGNVSPSHNNFGYGHNHGHGHGHGHGQGPLSAPASIAGGPKRRRKWDKPEDKILRDVVHELQRLNGPSFKVSWSVVAEQIPQRTAKQCRDRWNSITPGIQKKEWTAEEDDRLLALYEKHNNGWVRIAKEFPGRNDNMLKSRFRSLCKRPAVRKQLQTMSPNSASSRMSTLSSRSSLPSTAPPSPEPAAGPALTSLALSRTLDGMMLADATATEPQHHGHGRGHGHHRGGQDVCYSSEASPAHFTFDSLPGHGQMEEPHLLQSAASWSSQTSQNTQCTEAFPANESAFVLDNELAEWCAFMVQ